MSGSALRPDPTAQPPPLTCFPPHIPPRSPMDVSFGISDPRVGFIEATAPSDSIQTFLWKQPA